MIRCQDFLGWLAALGVDFYAGVPDSLLKPVCFYLADHAGDQHVVAANEGGAVALACGYHLATGKVPLVYLQNSGQGNAINPLLSLADRDVYGIPLLLLLLIGWRGEPGTKDEPQHVKQGKVTVSLLEAMDVPHRVLTPEPEAARRCVDELLAIAAAQSRPVALVVRKDTFEPYKPIGQASGDFEMTREQAIKAVVSLLGEADAIVSTTGKISRELYEYRDRASQGHQREFLTVGSMGHASQIAMGIALAIPDRQVFCLDGDGAMLMHMGGAAIAGAAGVANFKHVILNNGVHDSVGGMATAGLRVSFTEIVKACGYTEAWRVERREDVAEKVAQLRAARGPAMLEIMVQKGARADLGRPKTSPIENKAAFTKFLRRA
ncbi:MAG: phosphonopyruvate decarboxylase [Candidatus Nealsonbacteria bacterium]|nr:phosphonopyruvate decarboxylase [Candidatus Nealsonbacteria bacterium]